MNCEPVPFVRSIKITLEMRALRTTWKKRVSSHTLESGWNGFCFMHRPAKGKKPFMHNQSSFRSSTENEFVLLIYTNNKKKTINSAKCVMRWSFFLLLLFLFCFFFFLVLFLISIFFVVVGKCYFYWFFSFLLVRNWLVVVSVSKKFPTLARGMIKTEFQHSSVSI